MPPEPLPLPITHIPIEQWVILITGLITAVTALVNSLKQNKRLKLGNEKFAKIEQRIDKVEGKNGVS